jgi:hypothetical protein
MRRMILAAVALAGVAACGWPETKMVEVGAEQAAPAYTAGPDYVRTTALDGKSNVFVCPGGEIVSARRVPANTVLVC